MKTLKNLALACVAFLGLVTVANAQIDTMDQFKYTTWDTSYEALDGQRVPATLVLQGSRGYYDIPGARGDLYDIDYRFSEHRGKFTVTLTGRWALGSCNGSFRFQSSNYLNPPELNGSWRMVGHSERRWSGRLSCVARPNFGGVNTPRGGTYGNWMAHPSKPYSYRICRLPAGGHQYLISYNNNPNWVYWFNPATQVYWCACPTVNHPQFGNQVRNGQDLFLMAANKSSTIDDTQFPDPGLNGANFKTSATAKDKDGSTVTLNTPPTDLPS